MLFKSGVGIEIRNNQVNLVYLKASFKGITLAAESGLSLDPDKPEKERLNEAAAFINEFTRTHRISATPIYMGIPGELAVLRRIELPWAVRENLRGTLAYEMEKYVPFSAEDVCFDFQILSEDKAAEKLTVMLMAVRKEDIAPFLVISDLVEKGVSGIEIAPSAVANFYAYQAGNASGSSVILYSRDNGFDVLCVQGGALVHSRSINKTGGKEERGSAVAAHLEKVKEVFGDPKRPMRLILLGDASADETRAQIPGALGFDVTTLDIRRVGLSAERYLMAFGLAVKGIQDPPIQVNLMPPGLRKKPDRTSYGVMVVLCALLILSAAVWAGSHLYNQRRILNALDAELARLRTEAAAVDQMQAESEKIKKRIDYLASLRPGNVWVMDVLRELSQVLPMTAWVDDLKLSGNELTLYGTAESASELIPMLEEVPIFTDVRFLSTIRKGRDGKEVFRIGLKVSGQP